MRYRIGARALSIWSAWMAALLCVASCAAPAGAQTKIINGEPMLGWVNGTYEKPVIIEVVGDSNATTASGSSAPNNTDANHFYPSITPALAKRSPRAELGRWKAHSSRDRLRPASDRSGPAAVQVSGSAGGPIP